MSKVSFLIPTNKPPQFLNAVIQSIEDAYQTQDEHDFEVVVYSRENPNLDKVVWVDETAHPMTIIQSYNLMASYAVGDYLFFSADDYKMDNSFFSLVDNLAGLKNNTVLAPNHVGHPAYCALHSNVPILGCGLIHRSFYEKDLNSHIFHGDFQYHFSDNWLSVYLEHIGKTGSVVYYTGLTKLINHETYTSHDNHDRGLYEKLVKELKDGSRTRYV